MSVFDKITGRIRRLNELQQQSKKVLGINDEIVKKNIKTEFKLDIKNIKDLRIAGIMDEFTFTSYEPECKLLEVTPDNFKSEIDEFDPHLLFIESAWLGKDNLWQRKVSNCSSEFFELTNYASEKNIPIVFWNKEDPVHTDTFMQTAKLADFIFTTDIDCIVKYKKNVGHENVYHLHFAAQPKYHNPIEKFDRKDKFCFAGAYYHRYPVRAKTFDEFAQVFIDLKGFDIFDRNYQNALPEYAFPEYYNQYILGRLEPHEIDVAYKGYNFGINMNSVNQSQTMFARRVFEMLASNTVTVGNYSRGVKNYFGDLTICTDDDFTLKKQLDLYCKDQETMDKYRLLGLRKVLLNHLYEDRLIYILDKVFGKEFSKSIPKITVLAPVDNKEQAEYITNIFNSQNYEEKVLIFVSNDEIYGVETIKSEDISINEGFVALFSHTDYYGKNYLLDLALTLRYGNFNGVGKDKYYNFAEKYELLGENSYKEVSELTPSRAIFDVKSVEICDILLNKAIKLENMFSIDRFNYCENINENTCEKVDDLLIFDKGIDEKIIINTCEKIKIPMELLQQNYTVKLEDIANVVVPRGADVTFKYENNKVNIESNLEDGVHSYMYAEKLFDISSLIEENTIKIKFSGVAGLDLICVCVFFDENKNKLTPAYPKLNRNEKIEVPNGAKFVKIGFRPKGSGVSIIDKIEFGESTETEEKQFLSRSNVLVLSSQYPSKESLYRNMFVHQRMTSYKDDGQVYDMMRMHIYANDTYREFDGINVIEGKSQELYNVLENGNIDTVCVHFLDEHMWGVLKQFTEKVRILIWAHGSEIQPWWRREYIYETKETLENGKVLSDARMKLWHEVFEYTKESNIEFVFVSQYFADEVFEDYKVNLSKEKYTIIHNCIDTEIFKYEEKNAKQRTKIVSVRPYANNKYANDLTANAIKLLSKKPFFKELEFLIAGDGEMFEEITKPLRKFNNVTLEKRFFRQDEISKLYQENGIVLTPTRMDAQGVSRDEAMSCGCVPITNAVAAIPEFVDTTCGILADDENYNQMADGIEFLYNNPDKFLEMSLNASKRVRSQTSKEFTIDKEILIINRGENVKI